MTTSPLRLHVVSLPWTRTDGRHPTCAYTTKAERFCEMMGNRGHEVFLYSGIDNTAVCTEHVVAIHPEEQAGILGTTDAPWNPDHPAWVAMNARAAGEIARRALPTDFLCLITSAQKPIADALSHLTAVEYGVGYAGTFAPNKVYESYAWMHTAIAAREGADWDVNGATGGPCHWYDTVIPNYYRPEDFHLADPEGYFLFVGRGIARKGAWIAARVCEHLGVPLKIAGHDLGALPAYGDQIGVIGPAERADLMAGAVALFAPTTYCGPFEGVTVEAMLSGCPVITTDVGAFTENVLPGDGWRCHTMAEFVLAARRALAQASEMPTNLLADEIAHGGPLPFPAPASRTRANRRERAIARFSLDAIGPRYEEYFERLLTLWGEGWPALED